MPPEDRVRVLHMIEAAETALNFVSGRQRADLNSEPGRVDAQLIDSSLFRLR